MHKLIYIELGIPPVRDFKFVGNIPITLLQTCRATRINPQNPRIWRLLSNSIAVFNGKLRLPAWVSGPIGRICLYVFLLTLLHPSQRALCETLAMCIFGEADRVSLRNRQSLSPAGKEWWIEVSMVFPIVLWIMSDSARKRSGN